MLSIDDEYQQQFESFESFWDQKLKHYDIESKEIEQNLMVDHEAEREKYQEEVEQSLQNMGKMSSKFINLQFKMEQMAKNQRFREAAEIKAQLEDEYNKCIEKIEMEREAKVQKMMEKLMKKQENELKSLKQKITVNRNDLLKTKEKDYDSLVKKYKANKAATLSKIQLARSQKLKFLDAFDPSKNINVSKLYTKYFDGIEQDDDDKSGKED